MLFWDINFLYFSLKKWEKVIFVGVGQLQQPKQPNQCEGMIKKKKSWDMLIANFFW